MIKKKYAFWFLSIVFLLIIIALLLIYFFPEKVVVVKKAPNNKDNIFIFTVDDITLADPYEVLIMDKISNYLEEAEIPTTLFAIPSQMDEHNFSSTFEIGQHGYNHFNPLDGSGNEFKGLSVEEIEERLREGKAVLEEWGYEIKGQRAPGWSLEKGQIPLLKEIYDYDSSFPKMMGEDSFIIPVMWPDLTNGVCCDKDELSKRQELVFLMIGKKDRKQEPIVIVSHFWGFEETFNDKEGKDYLDYFFFKINKRNYWKTTLAGYQEWNKKREGVNMTWEENKENITVEFNYYLPDLTLEINSDKKVVSEYSLDCRKTKEREKQICLVS